MKFDKNFRTFDNQFLIKFWLVKISKMKILNPKFGTVPKQFGKYLRPTIRRTHSILINNRVCFGRRFKSNNTNYLQTKGRKKYYLLCFKTSTFARNMFKRLPRVGR